jgi:hypothetical protein
MGKTGSTDLHKLGNSLISTTSKGKNMQELITKKDLQLELAPLKIELQILKWINGLILSGIVMLILISFS